MIYFLLIFLLYSFPRKKNDHFCPTIIWQDFVKLVPKVGFYQNFETYFDTVILIDYLAKMINNDKYVTRPILLN